MLMQPSPHHHSQIPSRVPFWSVDLLAVLEYFPVWLKEAIGTIYVQFSIVVVHWLKGEGMVQIWARLTCGAVKRASHGDSRRDAHNCCSSVVFVDQGPATVAIKMFFF